MAEIHTYGDMFPIDETLCKDCTHRMSIVMVPLDPELYGVLAEELEDDDELMVEQHTCLVSGQDMDYIVTYCNHFESTCENQLIKNRLF